MCIKTELWLESSNRIAICYLAKAWKNKKLHSHANVRRKNIYSNKGPTAWPLYAKQDLKWSPLEFYTTPVTKMGKILRLPWNVVWPDFSFVSIDFPFNPANLQTGLGGEWKFTNPNVIVVQRRRRKKVLVSDSLKTNLKCYLILNSSCEEREQL